MIVNKSGLKPVGRAVLVLPYEPQKESSIIVLPESVRERAILLDMRVTIIEIGPEAWSDEKVPRCKVGDRVLVAKHSGAFMRGTLDDVQYRIVNDRDIFTVITGEKENG